MKFPRILFWLVCGTLFSSALYANANEEGRIKDVIQRFYDQNEKALQCRKKDGSVDSDFIKVPKQFFSNDFMMYYREVCLGKADFIISFDIRTADNGIYLYDESKASFSNLHIGNPSISGDRAVVTATYDLDEFSFKEWGNFTRLIMVRQGGSWKVDDIELGGRGQDRESITSLKSIKSLKKYIDESVRKSRREKLNN